MKNIDKLYKSVEQNGTVCVGLDTDFSYLPSGFKMQGETNGDAVFRFNKDIIEATRQNAACYKVQIAYYESMGLDGLRAYSNTLKYLKKEGLISIADIKRGDIAKTAEMYALAHFENDFEADFITLSPYMGMDSIEPYTKYFNEKGAFILVRTSNEGAKDFEYKKTEGGEHFYDLVGNKIVALGNEYLGECGYSSIGLVIGGTHIEEAKEIRTKYKNSFFLIPGYGAQGGKAADIAQYLINGNGGVVNASRSILLAYKKREGLSFSEAASAECKEMREAISVECKALRV